MSFEDDNVWIASAAAEEPAKQEREAARIAKYRKVSPFLGNVRMQKASYVHGKSQRRSFPSVETLIDYVKTVKVGYEEGKDLCIPFGDYDFHYDSEEEQKADWEPNALSIKAAWEEEYPDARVMMFCASGYDQVKKEWKNSFHVRVRGAGVYQSASCIPHILDVDAAPYKGPGKIGLFRLPYCSKEKDNRPLRRFEMVEKDAEDGSEARYYDLDNLPNGETYEEYLVWNRMGEYFRVGDIEVDDKGLKNKSKQGDKEPMAREASKSTVRALVSCLPDSMAEDWKQWLMVLRCLKNIGEIDGVDVRHIAHEFSMRSGKYNAAEVDNFMMRDETAKGECLKMGTLCYWAKLHNKKKYHELVDTHETDKKKTFEDHIEAALKAPRKYTYNEVFELRYKSFPDLYEPIKFLCDSVIHVISGGAHEVYTVSAAFDQKGEATGGHEYKIIDKPLFSGINSIKVTIGEKEKPMSEIYHTYYQTKYYKTMDFKPFIGKDPTPATVFNIFEGFAHKWSPEVPDGNALANIMHHIRHVVLKDDAYSYIWTMKWLNNLFKYPATKPGYSILLQSTEQGTGKNLMVSLIVAILGKKYYHKANSLDDVTGRFNFHLSDKLFVQGDELANYLTHRNLDKLKDAITTVVRSIERKGKERLQLSAYERYIFTSNSDLPLRIEASDRRIAVFNVSSEYKGNKDYFDRLAADIENRELQRQFFLYVVNTPEFESKDFDFNKIPQTALRKEIIADQIDPVIEFIKDYVESKGRSVVGQKINCKDIMALYETWRTANGERDMSSRKLVKELIKFGLIRFRSSKNRGVQFPEWDDLIKLFQKALGDDTYDIEVDDSDSDSDSDGDPFQ